MGLFDIFKKKLEPVKVEEPKVKKPRKPKVPKDESPSEKELAEKNNQPYVNVLKMEIDPYDINSGAFELDWNDKFVLNLIRAGYKIREDDTDYNRVLISQKEST